MYFANKVDEVSEERFLAEVFTDHLEDPAPHGERVVDSIESDSLYAVPAGPATTGDARVLDIVRDMDMGLELERVTSGHTKILGGGAEGEGKEEETDPCNEPADDGCLEVFQLCELTTLEDGERVNDAQTPVEYSTQVWDIIIYHLSGRSGRLRTREKDGMRDVNTNVSIVLDGLLWHVLLAEVC